MGTIEKQNFRAAAAIWEQEAAVKFVEQTTETGYVIVRNHPDWTSGDVASVGADGGYIDANFSNPAVDYLWKRVHELGHTLGFIHEHQRPALGTYFSRDHYLHVGQLLIDTEPQNYQTYPAPSDLQFYTDYDCDSVMHYPEQTGTSELVRMYSIVPSCVLNPRFSHLSDLDKQAIVKAYGPAAFRSVLTVDVLGTGGGTVGIQPPGEDLALASGSHLQRRYGSACIVSLQASAAGNSVFDGWKGDVDNQDPTDPTLSIIVISNKFITVSFDTRPDPPTNPPPGAAGPGHWDWDPTANGGRGAWVWILDPNGTCSRSSDGGKKPALGCWEWDPGLGSCGGWDYFTCGGRCVASGLTACNPVGLPVSIGVSGDPNDKIGPHGIASARYLGAAQALSYSIYFDNQPTATAPAQTITVTDVLNGGLVDLSTLALGPISFADKVVTPPLIALSALGTYSTNVDLRPAKNLIVAISASLNSGTGVLTWNFTSLDPSTGLLTNDPLAGLLPPGAEGSVSYTVVPKASPTGTQITNKATVVFDLNPPLDTPVWANSLDTTKPISRVAALPSLQNTSCFKAQWSGSDVGSGLQGFSVLVSDNGGPFTTWLTGTTATSGVFNGLPGHSYSFYSQARDLVGNVESAKAVADATTAVAGTATCNGQPSLSAAVSSKSTAGTTVSVALQLTNSGVGNAQAISINQITFRTLSGTGTVTLAAPTLPISVASLAAGSSVPLTLTLNVPTSVKQFSITESGALQDVAAKTYSFSVAQSIVP
jgi:hypothetical protein